MKPTTLALLVLLVRHTGCQDWVSPCPRLFKYEPRDPNEPDKWYGQVSLISDTELKGVWLRLLFDKPSIQLGNWFGDVATDDNKEYLIRKKGYMLKANTPETLRFYIKYDVRKGPPQLTGFRLNARVQCPEGGETTKAPQTDGRLQTSSAIVTTASSLNVPVPETPTSNGGSIYRPPSLGEEDDYFVGDLHLFNRPTHKPNLLGATCGTVIKQPIPLITHGQATHEGEFPWHAALYHAKGIDLTYICGASLISKYHVITVAHCVTKTKGQGVLPSSSFVVYLGKFYLKVWSNPGIQDKHVDKIIVHPEYNSQSFGNDVAILKLLTPAEITNFVRPICLWDGDTSLNTIIGKHGTVVGWGFDENGKVTEQLTKTHMPIVTQETCIYSFPDFYSRFTSEQTFCAGFKNGTSVCNGDSGGGMVFPKSEKDPNNPIWFLRGLVSISVAVQNQVRCDSSHYVVFTDTAKYLDWIKKVISWE